MPRPYIFQELAQQGRSAGMTPLASRKAIEWFRATAKEVRTVDVNRMTENTPSRMRSKLTENSIGQMWSFFYDAKHKDKLPWWDQHPLIIPFNVDSQGFTAWNLHYMSPFQRARILDGLYVLQKAQNLPREYLPASYHLLRSLARFDTLGGAVKRYLWGHVRSRFMLIRPTEWDMAIMLPTARFVPGTGSPTPHRIHRDTYSKRWKNGV